MTLKVPADGDVLWRTRWLLVASCALIAGALTVVIVTQATHWVWGLFLWGLSTCIAGAAVIETVAGVAVNRGRIDSASKVMWHRRRAIYAGLWIFWGVVIGGTAAAFDLVVIDVVATAYIALSFAAAGVGTAMVLRRRTRSSSGPSARSTDTGAS